MQILPQSTYILPRPACSVSYNKVLQVAQQLLYELRKSTFNANGVHALPCLSIIIDKLVIRRGVCPQMALRLSGQGPADLGQIMAIYCSIALPGLRSK